MRTLVYCALEGPVGRAIKQVLDNTQNAERIEIVTSDIRDRLRRGDYSPTIIDTSTVGKRPTERGTVQTWVNSVYLDNPPKVVCIYSSSATLTEIVKAIGGQDDCPKNSRC